MKKDKLRIEYWMERDTFNKWILTIISVSCMLIALTLI